MTQGTAKKNSADTTRGANGAQKKALPNLWQLFASFEASAHPVSFADWPLFNGQPVPLGGMDERTFIRDYWQKKPLLIRQALPHFKAFYTPEMVKDALENPELETRLIVEDAKKGWSLQHGPLEQTQIPPQTQAQWSALVQGVDAHHPLGRALIDLFRFIPDARLDDLMVSFATDQGGVGAHFDSYDVFLLQALGQKRWQISQQTDLRIRPDLPLKILEDFQVDHEWVLEEGDMLYLPPQYAHHGVAIGESMTYSIGFRAPQYQELATSFLEFVADNLELEGRVHDPDLQAQAEPALLPPQLVQQVYAQMQNIQWDAAWVAEFLGCYLTEPKPSALMAEPEGLSLDEFISEAEKKGLTLYWATKMLYRAPWIFINGEHFEASGVEAQSLMVLANQRCWTAQQAAQYLKNEALCHMLYTFFEQGAVCLGDMAAMEK